MWPPFGFFVFLIGFTVGDLTVERSRDDPSRSLDLHIAAEVAATFRDLVARVSDLSDPPSARDSNRTFRVATTEPQLRIHDLSPGHRYAIAVFGRRDNGTVALREESVLMSPISLSFDSADSILVAPNNISLKGTKAPRALQDKFSVKYIQLEPPKRFPTLDVYDIPEERFVEFYLGNLSPGRDFEITVTSVREQLQSPSYKKIITTKPLSPQKLSVSEVNSSCVLLRWSLPSDSGADRFRVAYGVLHGTGNTTKMEIPMGSEAVLCKNIRPGETFVFAVVAEKSQQISEPATISHTIRPLAPIRLDVRPDFIRKQFRIVATLPSLAESMAERCLIIMQNDRRVEQIVRLGDGGSPNECVVFADLVPGRRYEISAAAISSNVFSTKTLRSSALEPGFDMNSFGLSVRESKATIRIEWPSDSALSDLWTKIVGNESRLHIRVDSEKDSPRHFDLSPNDHFLQIDHLNRGGCYKIQMYTVTGSGIVSTNRFEENRRLSAPTVDLSVEKLSKNGAAIRVSVLALMEDPLHPVGGDVSDCALNVIIMDSMGSVVFDRTLGFGDIGNPSIILNGLRPFHKYRLRPKVICGPSAANSAPSQCSVGIREIGDILFQTQMDRPAAISHFTANATNPYSVRLSWFSPALPNGPITHYILQCSSLSPIQTNWTMNIGASDSPDNQTLHSAILDNLIGGVEYSFDIRAVNEAGIGEPMSENLRIRMPIGSPPRPIERVELVADSVLSNSFTVRFNSNSFNPKNGLLVKAALIVAQVSPDGRPIEQNETSWLDAQRLGIWPPFVAVEIPLEKRLPPPNMEFIEAIGVDSSCLEETERRVCNGPLKPESAYRVKLRLYSREDLWSESPYSDIVVTEALRSGSALRSVFALLSLLLCGSLLALLLLLIHSRRRPAKSGHSFVFPSFLVGRPSAAPTKETQWAALKMIMAERAADCLAKLGLDSNNSPPHLSAEPIDPDSARSLNTLPSTPFNSHHRRSRSLRERTGVDQRLERLPSGPPPGSKILSVPWTVIKGPGIDRSRPVRSVDFPDHVRLMSADSDYLFSVEYEELRFVGNGQTSIAAEMGTNRAKNRFTNILPYDHSRVRLQTADEEDGSDYVNASFISGFHSEREFIAAQGPLPSTRDHFWRVVWEQECPAIVALTKCVEKGRDKSACYWPDICQKTVLYGDIEVTLISEDSDSNEYTIRELSLTNLSEPSNPNRTVLHLHYMAWPDFGAPENPDGIVHFSRLFRSRLPPNVNNRPTIVHCSAGVGRSGTFIAFDRLLKNIEAGRALDVFGTVYEMRLERCHMVQNEQQYIFLHHCLLYVLQQFFPTLLGPTTMNSEGTFGSAVPPTPAFPTGSMWTTLASQPKTPRIEVHQNPAFQEDEEGIAESGL